MSIEGGIIVEDNWRAEEVMRYMPGYKEGKTLL